MQKTLAFFKKCCCFCCCCAEPEPDAFKECNTRNGGCECDQNIQLSDQNSAVAASAPPEVEPELAELAASMVDETRQAAHETFPEPSVMVEDPNEENGPELVVLPAAMVDEEERQATMVEK